nr:MAG: hypothetical protein [Microvirus sp.]
MDESDIVREYAALLERLYDLNVRRQVFGKSAEFKRLGVAAIHHAVYPSSATFGIVVEAVSRGDEALADQIFRSWGIWRGDVSPSLPSCSVRLADVHVSALPLFEGYKKLLPRV